MPLREDVVSWWALLGRGVQGGNSWKSFATHTKEQVATVIVPPSHQVQRNQQSIFRLFVLLLPGTWNKVVLGLSLPPPD
ncbi:MAG: hypothetical protein VR65_24915 [Desulfobulbaceae bacterium BRH_c16a]|nr:MAG: hypothetical protein VR65_24915 [Desulfobulbaceae bacterium BRH_c16a]